MSTHILFLLLAGIALFGIFYLPQFLRRRLLTIPIIYVGFGLLVFSLPINLPLISPEDNQFDRKVLEYLTELIVIVSLAGIGIKIDRKPSWANWQIGWYLLGIAMPLTIASMAALGYFFLDLPLATAILLGAVLAPTDPVLAGNVQVGPPNMGEESDVRFGLTLEAGLNDGLAFPFVYLAIALLGASSISSTLIQWSSWDFGYRIAVGLASGIICGRLVSSFFFWAIPKQNEQKTPDLKEGIFVLAAILVTYSLTELIEGYGFLAVFVAAVVGRQRQNKHAVHRRNYSAIDQVEQALLGTFLIAFGGVLATGGLSHLSWQGALCGIALLIAIRPLSAMLGFLGCRLPMREKIGISFFGIRGIGSIYYLAYAQNSQQDWPMIDTVWGIVNFTILASIIIHGLSVKPLMKWVDRAKAHHA
ncbi:MAG: cation:proton antiporter [Bacteroidota bacterium]